jgi:lipopolysaccharide/colanic/teichoic acid biosynthesis glycosyltransferase
MLGRGIFMHVSYAGDAHGGGSRPPAAHPRGLRDLLTEDRVQGVIRRETSRADRTGREFSVVLFRVKPAGRRGRKPAVSTCRLARALLGRIRETDDVGWFDDRHLCVVLPETPVAGARVFAARTCDEVARYQLRPAATVYGYPRDPVVEAPVPGSPGPQLRLARDHPTNGHPGADGPAESDRYRITPERANGRAHVNGHANGHAHANGHGGALAGGANPIPAAADPSVANARGLTLGEREQLVGYFLDGVAAAGGVGASAAAVGVAVAPAPAPAPAPARPAAAAAAAAAPADGAVEEFFVRPMSWPKRLFDLAGATLGMILLSPVLAAAAVAVKLTSRGPVIFTQQRCGLGGRPFTIYKFRTMCVGAERQQAELRKLNEQDGPAFKLTNDPRVTRVGRLLRKTSVDELPQLWNVIRGDMSLVGPRPLPLDEQGGCVRWQRHRLNVTPGLTCIWQVDGRGNVTFDEWVRMDVAYMRRQSVWRDLSILLRTIPAVLLRRGAK